jgi:hypothetical protein
MNTNKHNGSGDKILDWTVIVAAIILFFKTAEVMSYFAPAILSQIVGMDVSWLSGIVNALMVEGPALAIHFNRRARLSSTAQVVKWVLLAISGACQIFAGYLSTGNEANMSEPLKFGLQFGVPLIPIFVMVLLFAIGQLPDDGQPAPRIGLKHRLPDWNRIWNGDPVDVPAGTKERANHQKNDDAELEARPRRSK